MRVDDNTIARYQRQWPELLNAIEKVDETHHVMCKSAETGACTKLENGLCSIHIKYGAEALGDACYFYPRSARRLGEKTILTGAISCPEMLRLLLVENAFETGSDTVERLPQSVQDYCPAELSSDQAWQTHQSFCDFVTHSELSGEWLILNILAATQGLATINVPQWDQAAPFYLRMAAGRIPETQPVASDSLNLLLSLVALLKMSDGLPAPQLRQLIARISSALQLEIDWEAPALRHSQHTAVAITAVQEAWDDHAQLIAAPIFRRWLHAQLASSLFPFSGFGHTEEQRVVVFGVRLATLKLALASRLVGRGTPLTVEEILEDAQTLARFMDHLADPTMSLNIYQDFGWTRIARLRGLLGV